MKKIDELLKKIEELRSEMNNIIDIRDNLQDNEILHISRRLDGYLVEYQRLLRNKKHVEIESNVEDENG